MKRLKVITIVIIIAMIAVVSYNTFFNRNLGVTGLGLVQVQDTGYSQSIS